MSVYLYLYLEEISSTQVTPSPSLVVMIKDAVDVDENGHGDGRPPQKPPERHSDGSRDTVGHI